MHAGHTTEIGNNGDIVPPLKRQASGGERQFASWVENGFRIDFQHDLFKIGPSRSPQEVEIELKGTEKAQ